MSLSAAVSHFLNCFFSSCQMPHPVQAADEVSICSFTFEVTDEPNSFCSGQIGIACSPGFFRVITKLVH